MGLDWSQQVKPPKTAAVDKPQATGVGIPTAEWEAVSEPVYYSGEPFVVYPALNTAAVLSAAMQAALDKHNVYRARHQVGLGLLGLALCRLYVRHAASCTLHVKSV